MLRVINAKGNDMFYFILIKIKLLLYRHDISLLGSVVWRRKKMQEEKERKKSTTSSSDDLMRKMKVLANKKSKKTNVTKTVKTQESEKQEPDQLRPMHLVLHELKTNADKILVYSSPITMAAYYNDSNSGNDILSTYMALKHDLPLWDFQETAVEFIKNREADIDRIGCHGALLCDEMGMGKSKSVLTVILEDNQLQCKKTGKRFDEPTLIVCTDILINNWITEIKTFPKYAFEYIDMTEKKMRSNDLFYFKHACDIVFTTYATVANAYKNKAGDEYNILYGIKWRRVVADEAQQIVTETTLAARAMMELDARSKIVVTGTPVQNREKDVWTLLRFIGLKEDPGESQLNHWLRHLMIRRNMSQFEGCIGKHIPQKNRVHRHVDLLQFSTLQEKCLYYNYAKYALTCRQKKRGDNTINIPPLIQLLRQLCIGPHAVKQLVVPNGVLVINQPNSTSMTVSLNRHQPTSTPAIREFMSQLDPVIRYHYSEGHAYRKNKEIYNDALLDNHMVQTFSSQAPFKPSNQQEEDIYREFKESNGNVSEKMCQYGSFNEIKGILSRITASTINLNWPSTKEKAVLSIVKKSHKDSKIIVFASFASTLQHLSQQLKYYGYQSVILCGDQSRVANANSLRESRDNPDVKVLLTSLKIGNIGLNIGWINTAIFYDIWWNPQIHNQAERRIDRPGCQTDIHIYYLIMDHTIELYIMNLLAEKKRIAEFLDFKSLKKEVTEIDEVSDMDETSDELTLNKIGLTDEEACKLFDYDITFG